jgi:hypothetical protein
MPTLQMQKEWIAFGEEAFVFEILEMLDRKADEPTDLRDALKKLEAKWFERLQPFGEHGYN